MKLKAKTSNEGILHFNDVDAELKGVSPQMISLTLNPGQEVYLPARSGLTYSVMQGDAHRFEANNMLDINDTVLLAAQASLVINHNFNYLPHVSVWKLLGGAWVLAVNGVEYIAVNNAAKTQMTITNIAGGPLTFNINVG